MRNSFFHPIAWLSVGLGLLLLSCTVTPASTDAPSEMAQSSTQTTQTPTVQENLAQMLPISAEAEIAGQVIQLEVANTPDQQAKGLMYRPALPDNRGMLFPFDPPRPVRFWMMNTPQPLDMVFLLNGEVQGIVASAPPCTSQPCPTYGPNAVVNQVIELRSGRAAELGLKKGDRVNIRFLEK